MHIYLLTFYYHLPKDLYSFCLVCLTIKIARSDNLIFRACAKYVMATTGHLNTPGELSHAPSEEKLNSEVTSAYGDVEKGPESGITHHDQEGTSQDSVAVDGEEKEETSPAPLKPHQNAGKPNTECKPRS